MEYINDNRFIIINKNNSGYGDSMNQGLNFANGEYIGIVESDDFVDIEMFNSLYNSC
jgi:glycosyltransferase involved in cell wall biosynthesis